MLLPLGALIIGLGCTGCGPASPPTTPRAAPTTPSRGSTATASASLTPEQRIGAAYAAGAYADAESLARARLATLEAGHAASMSMLAPLRWLAVSAAGAGSPDKAIATLRRSLTLAEDALTGARTSLTEAKLAAFFAYLRLDEELAYSLAAARPHDAEAAKLALAYSAVRKARSLEEVVRTYDVFRTALAATDLASWHQLRVARRAYATLALLGGDAATIDALERKAEGIEERLTQDTSLAQYAAGALAMSTNPALAAETILAIVGTGQIFIDIVQYRRFDFGAAGRVPRGFGEREYLALVVRGGEVHAVRLGSAAAIDAAVHRFLAAVTLPDADPMPAARAAYEAIVAPMRGMWIDPNVAYVEQFTTLSLDGELLRMPFEALHDGKQYLIDAYRFVYANAGRDVFFRGPRAVRTTSVVVLANPDFSAAFPLGMKRTPIAPLPGTADEAAALAKLFPKAEVRTGAEASKDALLAVTKPGILHVATHGIFVEERAPLNVPGLRGLELHADDAQRRAPTASGPLVRSALVLTGSGGQGGFVTALDAAGLDLAGTQLVVLSACSSARGQVHLGQGVFGLRRALFAAGAETVVTSLWEVDDEASRDLMMSYYTNLLRGEGRSDAMRAAARAVRRTHEHPYYWAPFIVIGDAGRIEGAVGAAIPPPTPPQHGIIVTPVNPR